MMQVKKGACNIFQCPSSTVLNPMREFWNQKFADATYKTVEMIAHEIVKKDSDLYFTRKFRARTHRGVILYTAQTMVSLPIGQSIVEAYRDE